MRDLKELKRIRSFTITSFFLSPKNKSSSRKFFATAFQSAQISITTFPLHVFHAQQKQKKRYMKSLVKRGRGKGEGGMGYARDRHRSRDHEGARGSRGERERIARRAKVPSKHGTGMTRNSAGAGSAFQANVMRCEAINAPSTRLDLRLHRHGAYSAARPLLASPRARLKHSCQPVRFHFGLPDGYSPR